VLTLTMSLINTSIDNSVQFLQWLTYLLTWKWEAQFPSCCAGNMERSNATSPFTNHQPRSVPGWTQNPLFKCAYFLPPITIEEWTYLLWLNAMAMMMMSLSLSVPALRTVVFQACREVSCIIIIMKCISSRSHNAPNDLLTYLLTYAVTAILMFSFRDI